MALVRTNVGHFESAGVQAGTTFTTGSFTPANNSLLVVAAQLQDATISTDTMTITDTASLSWTARVTTGVDPSFSAHKTVLYTAPVTTGSSMTVTVGTLANGSAEFAVHVFTYTGYNTGTPIGATATGTSTGGGAVTITLSASPALSSEVLASANADSTGGSSEITTGTGWTQQFHASDTANLDAQTQTRTNSTSTTVTWNNIATSDVTAAMEIIAASSVPNVLMGQIML